MIETEGLNALMNDLRPALADRAKNLSSVARDLHDILNTESGKDETILNLGDQERLRNLLIHILDELAREFLPVAEIRHG